MKIRTGFVSNSSSSSFCCPICYTQETGWDGEYDIDTFTCESCWKEMCTEHISGKSTYSEEYECDIPDCPLCELEEIEDWKLLSYLEEVDPKIDLGKIRKEIKEKYKEISIFDKAIKSN